MQTNASVRELFQLLTEAAAGGQDVYIRYRNAEGTVSRRWIKPKLTYTRYNNYYVRAHCYLRGELRTFALSRMKLIEPPTPAAPYEAGASLRHPPAPQVTPSAGSDLTAYPSAGRKPLNKGQTQLADNTAADTTKGGHAGWSAIALLGIGILFALAVYKETPSTIPPWPGSTPKTSASTTPDPTPESAPPIPLRWKYRGYEIHRTTDGVTIPTLSVSTASGRAAHYLINSLLFTRETGINDSSLWKRYMAADSDGNGHLSWKEVVAFQHSTYREFTYRENRYALRPDQFIAHGGGDCEDFALYTCGMLRFWGWNCKVASFFPPAGGNGHAIAFVWTAEPIPGIGSIHVPAGTYVGGNQIKPGYWIPIDYNQVGSFSNSMGSNWKLWELSDPQSLYGRML